MRTTLTIVDDFHPDALGVRESALGLEYETVSFAGHDFHGIGQLHGFDVNPLIEGSVGFPIHLRMGFFRLGMDGQPMTTFIHADKDCGQFAGVLYLNLPHQNYGGTAFWKHKAAGWEEVPEGVGAAAARMLDREGQHDNAWEQQMFVPMKFNRFIAYRSQLFHSRYPNEIAAAVKEDGRLVYACFFDRKEAA